jgi:type I restriction enzyme, S subunit
MGAVENIITDNLPIWSSTIQSKSSAGRGTRNKRNLYGVKKLRELILDLAVRGLLVPQDPSDEPASVLLEKIATEKERLVNEGKIKKQKSEAKIHHKSTQFTTPDGWVKTTFGKVMLNLDSQRIPIPMQDRKLRSGPYPYYGASGVIDKIDGYLFDKTLLLIGEDGANLVNRSTPIAFLATDKFWVNNHAHVLDAIDDITLHYMSIHINAIDLIPYITGMAQPKLNQAKMNSIHIMLPPLAEQHRIVAKVDELMALCDTLEQQQEDSIQAHETLVEVLLEALSDAVDTNAFEAGWGRISAHFDVLFTTDHSIKKLKETILQLAVMGKLVPQDPSDEPASVLLEKIAVEKERLIKAGKIKKQKPLSVITIEEKPFDLPKGWNWQKMGHLATQITDGVHHTPKYIDSGVPFISVKDINGSTISFENCKYISREQHKEINLRCNPEYGDVLICRIGTLGRVTLVDTEEPFSLFVSVGLIKFIQKYYMPLFTHIVLQSPLLTNQYEEIKAGGSHTNKLNLKDIPRLILPVAPLAEQHRIVAKVDELMALCDQLKNSLQQAQETQIQLTDAVVENAL